MTPKINKEIQKSNRKLKQNLDKTLKRYSEDKLAYVKVLKFIYLQEISKCKYSMFPLH